MSDRTLNTDDATYGVDLHLPQDIDRDKYRVDLVRYSEDDHGLPREQRRTLATYDSYGEAEEHFYEAEQNLAENSLDGFDVEGMADLPYSDEPLLLAALYPPDEIDEIDDATVNLLAIGTNGVQTAQIVVGERQEMAQIVDDLGITQATGGDEQLLETARVAGDTPAQHPFARHEEALRLVDGGGTAHWFAVVENNEPQADPYELRYFRELELDDGEVRSDSYPVMPLPDDDPGSAWALPGLEMYLQKGDLFTAQQFAHDVADAYGADFPPPIDLPALDPRPEYYFGYGISDHDLPSLEAVKTWMDGAERRFDTLTVGEYGMFEEAAVDERELETLLDEQGVEAAMNLAETMAVAGGYLDPERDDPRIFFEDDAPSDPFTTNRERELAEPRYSIGATSANGESFLDVYKQWGTEDYERLVVPQPTWELAKDAAIAANDFLDEGQLETAMRLVEDQGVSAGVIDPERDDPRLFTQGPPDPFTTNREEEIDDELARYGVTWRETQEWAQPTQPDVTGLEEGYHRLDVREVQTPEGEPLGYSVIASAYPQMPVDFDDDEMDETRYPTEAWALDVAHFDDEPAAQEFAVDNRETPLTELTEDAVGESWQAWNMSDINRFMAGRPQEVDPADWQPEPQAEVGNPYWRMETLPVNDPDGEPLGHSLHMVVYDGVEHDPEMVVTPAIPEDEPFRMLEIAHFETTEAADKFGVEFNGYLMPGLLEGPELAEEVARLEGHPVEWKTLDGQELDDYRDLKLTLTRDLADWQPYNPNAERDARLEAEGLYDDLTVNGEPTEQPTTPDLDF